MYKVMLADEMSSYIANFVKTGNPNGEGLAEWETCTEENSGSFMWWHEGKYRLSGKR